MTIRVTRAFRALVLVWAVFWPSGAWGGAAAPSPEEIAVRIAVLKDAEKADIRIRGEYILMDPLSAQVLARDSYLIKTTLFPARDGIRVGAKLIPLKRVRFVPQEHFSLFRGRQERKYRGVVDVFLTPERRLLFVNTVDLEEYIKGVLYHEVSHRWPLEAIKAQAVAVRSYAIYQIQQNKNKDYDMTNDIYSQVYGGKTSERYRTNLAVQRTRGEILVFEGKILPAYYHATCGGHTENVNAVWKQELYPLKGVRCLFCAHSPHYSWKKNFRLKDIQDKLNKGGYAIGLIKTIDVRERTVSGRVKTLDITGRKGDAVIISGKDFRNIIGPNELRSNDYRVFMKGYYCDFVGRGWGHGVGMCQWGAMGMAKEQHMYDEILAYYYPGAQKVFLRSLETLQ
ncbi:MAG TPA: SpoIID/LytB domain-containing protein [Candidatus Omnitrophota bacterium]|nr:SpoIID/LytB domain-containing protein [Candidatus Omnitrophota bacterium]HPB67892.1 SpoIID/LytB domain-containing protein [Candidatus Omnitrophota bacterium]HQO57315.1 SpoIID/LytB domain-containing protein [Candidatus Omnitrophota bacterium]HQP12478.1 SpoIID/LytB domain-containing protein [Candidatus Omnitrophota bacterium]